MMDAMNRALAELNVVDLGRGMAAAIATKLLAGFGARVQRFEAAAGDPFYGVYPAYARWHEGATVAVALAIDDPAIADALAVADVCIVGGEDFPGYDWQADAAVLSARFPQLTVLAIEGYPADGAAAGRPAVELLVQARSGLAFEQFSDRPIQLSFAPASYAAALNGLIGLIAALCQRERGRAGEVVHASLFEGALTFAAQLWMEAAQPSGSFGFVMPKNPHPLIFRCRDGRYLHFVLGSFGSKGRLYRILKIDDPSVGPDDSGVPTGRGEPRNFFGDIDVLAEHVAKVDSDWLMREMLAAGIAANFVLAPGECWDDEQVRHIGTIVGSADGGRKVGMPVRGALGPLGAEPLLPGEAGSDLPLAGLGVLDFGMFVAGPFGTVPLADLGADVIKVETLQGDPNRNIFRPYTAVNRGKRSIAIDLKTPDGMAIARRLSARAHILHNNFRPGVSARLGVDPATQHQIDPGKVVLESTGCGRSGPHGDRAGFDMIFQAFCGHEVRAGGAGNMPMWDRTSMVDFFTGLLNALATVVAAWRRFRGGGGADIELSLLDAGLFLMSELIETAEGKRSGAPLLNAAQTGYHPAEALYACADGWIAIAARGEPMAAALAATLGLDLGPRAGWGEAEERRIAAALGALSLDNAMATLEGAGIWCERCNGAGERLLQDDADAPGIAMTSAHPIYGQVSQIGGLFRIGGKRVSAPRGAPQLGEHSREILAELGYAADEIDDFCERRVVA